MGHGKLAALERYSAKLGSRCPDKPREASGKVSAILRLRIGGGTRAAQKLRVDDVVIIAALHISDQLQKESLSKQMLSFFGIGVGVSFSKIVLQLLFG